MKSLYGKVAIIAMLLVAIVGVVQLKQRQGATASAPANTANALPRLLELGSDSCRPCQMMQPILADLRKDYPEKLQVDFIDIWKDASLRKAQSVMQRYGIQAIPTQIFFDATGKEVFRHTGYYPKEDILAKFKEFGIAL